MANQHDVARMAGVSTATVSRYLTSPSLISAKNAKTIEQAIAALNYRPDHSAQTLKTGRSYHVGVMSPDLGAFHTSIFQAVQSRMAEEGYYCTIFDTRGPGTRDLAARKSVFPILRGRQIDGALFLPQNTPEDDLILEQLRDWGQPYVVLDRPLASETVAQVAINNYAAGRQAARAFLDRGHRDFLFVWGLQEFPSAQDRFFGFRDELKAAGIALSFDRQLEGNYAGSHAYRSARAQWDRLPPFTAVFAGNDPSAYGFLKAARERGFECPRDFSLIGFDDDVELSTYFDVPLASFRQPAWDLGQLGAQMLLDLIQGRPVDPRRVNLDTELVIRASLGTAPKTGPTP